jgi:hypothetical protein
MNAVGIGTALAATISGMLRRAKQLIALGYLLSLAVLAVCAFPLFGPTQ